MTAPQGIRPASWEQQAVDAIADDLAQGWGYPVDSVMPARIAASAVRAIIDAGLAGNGGRCPKCGTTYPRTMPAGTDQRCTTCSTEDVAGLDEADRATGLDIFAVVRRVAFWLADTNGTDQGQQTLQILKVVEESGEVAGAWIGVTGQNPRKGVTHTIDQVADELADVVLSALVAVAGLDRDPEQVMQACLAKVAHRLAQDAHAAA